MQLEKKGDSMPIDTIERMAEAMAKSGIFGVNKKEDMFSLMLLSQAEGKHPALCAKEYHMVKGRPTLSADAMLARFQQAGGRVEWEVYTDTEVVGIFKHPLGGELKVDWTMQRAKNAGIDNNPTWKKFPRNMLRARCITEGVRTVFPAICTGIYETTEIAYDDSIKAKEQPVEKEAEQLVSDADINHLLAIAEDYQLTQIDLQNYFGYTIDMLPYDRYSQITGQPDKAFTYIKNKLNNKKEAN
jgi:hypothetical protein